MELCVRAEFPEESPREGTGESTAGEPSTLEMPAPWGITAAAWSAASLNLSRNKLCVLQRVGVEKASSPLEDVRHWALSYLYN